MTALLFVLALSAQTVVVPKGHVENAKILDSDKNLLTISYNLVSNVSDAVFDVYLEVKFDKDDPESEWLPAQKVNGEIGKRVHPGKNLRFQWDAGEFGKIVDPDKFRFDVRLREGPMTEAASPPSAPSPRYGRLTVTSTPAGADVLLGNISKGATPLELDEVIAMTYDLRVRPQTDDYIEDHRQITIAPGQQQTVDVVLRSRPVRRVSAGATFFTSADARDTSTLLGSHQALGASSGVRVGLGKTAELGFEMSTAFKEALDSTHAAPTAEERYLNDRFVTATLARPIAVGSRGFLVPAGGAGLGFLHTKRFFYAATSTAVQTSQSDVSETVPAAVIGADLRLAVTSRLWFVAGYRMYLLTHETAAGNPRPRMQQRPGVGIEWKFGGRP